MFDFHQLSSLLEFLPDELFRIDVALLNVVVLGNLLDWNLKRISDLSFIFCDV